MTNATDRPNPLLRAAEIYVKDPHLDTRHDLLRAAAEMSGTLNAHATIRTLLSAMRAWDAQLAADDGSFGIAEVRQAIRATLDAIGPT